MNGPETLHDFARSDTVQLTPDMPIRRAVAMLVQQNTAAAPVMDDSGTLLGILSQKDCFRPSLNASYYQEWTGTVANFMSPNPMTLQANVDVITAAEAFLEHPYRMFPILEGERFIGMLHRSDVLRRLVELG